MKKSLLISLFSLLLIIIGCRSDDFDGATTLQPVPFTVFVKFDQSVGGYVAKNSTVKLKNDATGEEFSGKTDDSGELKLTQVLPGTYSVIADLTLNKDDYYTLFGITTTKAEVNFNGSQEKVTINANIGSTNITLSNGTVGDWVIKQIYYAGSDTKNGALFRDQFIEIHNNSNKVMYADGLHIGFLEGNINNTLASFTLPSGQFDWSLSPNNSIGSLANTDYVYASAIIKLPGTGNQYPVQPGESIVIAQTGINHKAPYTNLKGDDVKIIDPTLTIDLSKADFETYLGDYYLQMGENPLNTDIQNPLIPDVEIVTWDWNNKDMLLNSNSRNAVVILSGVTDAEIKSFPKIANPQKPTGNTFVRLPKTLIMDGVDIGNRNSSIVPKDLTNDIDAGKAGIVSPSGDIIGDYTSYSVIRKTKTTINGRRVFAGH